MNHTDAEDLLAGFVLGALETQEQQDLLSHIQTCVLCHILVEEHMEVGAKLAAGIPEAESPASLRIRTLASIDQSLVHRVRPVAHIHNWPCPGLGWPSISGTNRSRLWRWTGK